MLPPTAKINSIFDVIMSSISSIAGALSYVKGDFKIVTLNNLLLTMEHFRYDNLYFYIRGKDSLRNSSKIKPFFRNYVFKKAIKDLFNSILSEACSGPCNSSYWGDRI